MKLIGAIVGVACAWAMFRYAPAVVCTFYGANALATVVAAVAALLSAPWAVALSRLSVFEKLDDLTSVQNEIVVARAKAMRRFVIRSLILNALSIVWCAIVIAFEPKSPVVLYSVAACSLFWLTGFLQAYKCWTSADDSRLAIIAAQVIEKNRKKYLDALRDDDRKSPIDRNDPHLTGYTR